MWKILKDIYINVYFIFHNFLLNNFAFFYLFKLYGRRAPWEDPAEWVYETYPWPIHGSTTEPQLLRLRPEDVGYEGHPGPTIGSKSHSSSTNNEADPLVNSEN